MPLPDRPIACGAALRAAVFAAAAATASCATQTGPYDPLASLFAAERAFAQQSVREGMRAAFAANFAADGVVLWPAPVRLHDALAAQPAPADPKSFTLDWRPVAGGLARSAEMGFTTGPWTRTDNVGGTPPRHGIFFSVWKRHGERWQVVADAGAQTAQPVADAALAPGPRVGSGGAAEAAALHALERGVASQQAYATRFADDAMLASDAAGVVRGSAIASRWRGDFGAFRLEPSFAEVAASGDLAYTYGGYATNARKGSYLHLWTRDAQGQWRIAAAIHQDG